MLFSGGRTSQCLKLIFSEPLFDKKTGQFRQAYSLCVQNLLALLNFRQNNFSNAIAILKQASTKMNSTKPISKEPNCKDILDIKRSNNQIYYA